MRAPVRHHRPSSLPALLLPLLQPLLLTLVTRSFPTEAKDAAVEFFIQFDSRLVAGQDTRMQFRVDEDLASKARAFLATTNLTTGSTHQQLWGCQSADQDCLVRKILDSIGKLPGFREEHDKHLLQEVAHKVEGGDTHLIIEASDLVAKLKASGVVCEMDMAGGGGLVELLMRRSAAMGDVRPMVAISSPSNQGKEEVLAAELFQTSKALGVPLRLLETGDAEYFQAASSDGEDSYALVVFSKAQPMQTLRDRMAFFAPRTTPGGVWVFSEVSLYDHFSIHMDLTNRLGFTLVHRGGNGHRVLYQKIGGGGRDSSIANTKLGQSDNIQELAGPAFSIFRPLTHFPALANIPTLLAPPEAWLPSIEKKLETLDNLTLIENPGSRSRHERARAAYTQALSSLVSGSIYRHEELSVSPTLGSRKAHTGPFNARDRDNGQDWAYLGDTMTGIQRLGNVEALLIDVFRRGIPGGYIELGVWRGGSSMLARGVMRAYGEGDRAIYVCDSFQGLPPGERKLHGGDAGWDGSPYLEVDAETVAQGFKMAGVMDLNVVFAKGFFNETAPRLAKTIDSLAIIRSDGDMYESMVDVLYTLYEKLEIGGYFIVDDWKINDALDFPAKHACMDFFEVHGHHPEIIPIDAMSVYWKKTEHVDIQHWRYEKSDFKP